MTVAMSLLVHGEAVRFNRGQSRGDDFDFKYMRGRDGLVFPYVSSQCYKKYWREALPGPFSPIKREKDASGKEKNQAYTDGNPIIYLDDDLFGYMIAGATDEAEDTPEDQSSNPSEQEKTIFDADNIKDLVGLKSRLLDASSVSEFILSKSPGLREILEAPTESAAAAQEAILQALDEAARSEELPEIGAKGRAAQKHQKPKGEDEIRQQNKNLLRKLFSKELQDKPKRPTTKRTAPVRMHALIAFSGIRTAKDFQTFSRDIAYTGKNSIVNPSVQGIYSAWLKTRILIESHRIGKFYIGTNMDILPDQAKGMTIHKEPNPYSREGEFTNYVLLESAERTSRLQAILRALADVGNMQGPASGALHDGSLRPKAFIAGMMNCSDSPFDYVWAGHNSDRMPYLDVNLLRESIRDWEDLFSSRTIFIGLPVDAGDPSLPPAGSEVGAVRDRSIMLQEMKETIEAELKKVGFSAVVDTPRKALLKLAQEASL